MEEHRLVCELAEEILLGALANTISALVVSPSSLRFIFGDEATSSKYGSRTARIWPQ